MESNDRVSVCVNVIHVQLYCRKESRRTNGWNLSRRRVCCIHTEALNLIYWRLAVISILKRLSIGSDLAVFFFYINLHLKLNAQC